MNIRTGIGYDVHKMREGRTCVIGGVVFDHPKGPLGHSDGDVLLHAVCDALLGAVNLGDLGDHFPDSDPAYKNADSRQLLQRCHEMVRRKGYEIVNLDAVVVCEEPRIKPLRHEIQACIARLLSVSPEVVSIKATTEDGMGITADGNAIKAWVSVLVAGR